MIVWFRDIVRSNIIGFSALLLIFSGISNILIWTIFLQCPWCIEINVEFLHMFIRSSLTINIFISVGAASCSLKSPQSWWANGIGVYRVQSITGKNICCCLLPALSSLYPQSSTGMFSSHCSLWAELGRKEREIIQTVEHISAEGPPGRSLCRVVHDLPCSVPALCVAPFSCKKLKVWK